MSRKRKADRDRRQAELNQAFSPVDMKALGEVSESGGFVRTGDGGILPVVRPLNGVEPHHMDFDRQVCAAGLKAFVRPFLPSDNFDGAPPTARFNGEWIMVREAAQGIRLRMAVAVCWPSLN